MKGKMEITLGVAVGSSIQISLGVLPVLILAGWAMDKDLTLYFENFEVICYFLGGKSIFLMLRADPDVDLQFYSSISSSRTVWRITSKEACSSRCISSWESRSGSFKHCKHCALRKLANPAPP